MPLLREIKVPALSLPNTERSGWGTRGFQCWVHTIFV
jgi:hypothetical protein